MVSKATVCGYKYNDASRSSRRLSSKANQRKMCREPAHRLGQAFALNCVPRGMKRPSSRLLITRRHQS